jgi:hypothetical protein
VQQCEAFGRRCAAEESYAREIAARTVEAGYHPALNRIGAGPMEVATPQAEAGHNEFRCHNLVTAATLAGQRSLLITELPGSMPNSGTSIQQRSCHRVGWSFHDQNVLIADMWSA